MKKIVFSLVIFLSSVKGDAQLADSVAVNKIWDQAPHNAFTDLIRYKNRYYCTFREGTSHVTGNDGTARVIVSDDGKHWSNFGSLHLKDRDLRDPKMSVTPDNRLMILVDVEENRSGKVISRKPYVAFLNTRDLSFSKLRQSVVDKSVASWSDWLWRLTWHDKTGYAINYQAEGGLCLMKTSDGSSFENISRIDLGGYANESTIRFDSAAKMYVLIRRDEADRNGIIATARPPYTSWTLDTLDQRIGGPDFLFLNDSTLCIGTRFYPESGERRGDRTGVLLTDLQGKTKKKLLLPSGGDTSYPGMLIQENELWMSYYSSHEGKTSIYFAKIPLSKLNE